MQSAAHRGVYLFDGEAGTADPPASGDDEARLWLQLTSCSSLIEMEIRQRLRDQFDFSPARFDLLAQLARSKTGMALSDISKHMMVSQSNVTALTSRLLQSGHIRRTASPTDRRVQIVSLTALGRSAFRKMAAERAKWVAELFANVSAKHRAMLMKDLTGLKQCVADAIAGERPRVR